MCLSALNYLYIFTVHCKWNLGGGEMLCRPLKTTTKADDVLAVVSKFFEKTISLGQISWCFHRWSSSNVA